MVEGRFGKDVPIWSVIVFSDKCLLKSVHTESENVRVIQCSEVKRTVEYLSSLAVNQVLSETEIGELYDKLYPCSQVEKSVKDSHKNRVKRNYIN